jgi:RNA polymerase sigma factor (sigma-70 family)
MAMPRAAISRVMRALTAADVIVRCDRVLLEKFVSHNDQAAFAELVSRHQALVEGVCRRTLPNAHDVEDACQAVFLLLARRAGAIRWRTSVAGWLYASARKVAHNARVASARRARRETHAAVPEAVPPVDTLSGRELLQILDEELDNLAPRYREPLVLCYLEELTRDEAAVRLGVSEATLKSQLERGRKKLADALTRRGCALGLSLLATAVTSTARASAPMRVDSILAAASGAPSSAATALVKGVVMKGFLANARCVALTIVALTATGIGFTALYCGSPPTGQGGSRSTEAPTTSVAEPRTHEQSPSPPKGAGDENDNRIKDPPGDVFGTVRAVLADGSVLINIGSESGIAADDGLLVYRVDPRNPKASLFVGELVVTRTEPKQAVGRFRPNLARPDRLPKENDIVATNLDGIARLKTGDWRQVAANAHELDRPDNWTLNFRFKEPRIIVCDVPFSSSSSSSGGGSSSSSGSTVKQTVCYMLYQVINLTSDPRTFVPDFGLKDQNDAPARPDELFPVVLAAISKTEDPNDEMNIKSSVSIGKEPIPVSTRGRLRPVTGVAIWTGVDEQALKNRFSIFIAGLSDGWQLGPALKVGEPPPTLRKTLQINFERMSDSVQDDGSPNRRKNDHSWYYRADNRPGQ